MNYLLRKLFKHLIVKEKVVIFTENYEIEGYVYNTSRKHGRFLSDLLNSANKNFIAVTDCTITHIKQDGKMEHLEFLQLNMRYVVLIKPYT